MEKPTRLAACEPCRQLKLACDHTRPNCLRCSRAEREHDCVYRQRPFKRRRRDQSDQRRNTPSHHVLPPHVRDVQISPPDRALVEPASYPNAGHLGPTSHTVIFNRLVTDNNVENQSSAQTMITTPQAVASRSKRRERQAVALEELHNVISAESFRSLINFWSVKKVNLSLGGPFLDCCTQALCDLLAGKLSVGDDVDNMEIIARRISENSLRPLNVSITSTLQDLQSAISAKNMRWETMSLALVVAGRATADISFFPPLYTDYAERRAFLQSITEISDQFLEFAILSDYLNDIQLICQYESFILHSVVDGDQSYSTWRRLGDVISSMLFLGLNERIQDDNTTPPFLAELRRTMFAQIYADDKNEAIFLGRSPRLHKHFCCFQLPGLRQDGSRTGSVVGTPLNNYEFSYFGPEDRIDPVTGLRWTACCASLKEEILEITHHQDKQVDNSAQRLASISLRAKSLWSTLPAHLKLQDSLRNHRDQTPFARDFLLTVRMDYLQVLFLVENCAMNQDSQTTADGLEVDLLQISQEILSLVVEAIVLRDQLHNSGSSVIWKVLHYGLPAAGLICVTMLRSGFRRSHIQALDLSKTMQNLGVLVSEVQLGGLLEIGDPNYALLYQATKTIESVLRTAYSSEGFIANSKWLVPVDDSATQQVLPQQTDHSPSDLISYAELWGSEYDFWQDLGDHLSLLPTQM